MGKWYINEVELENVVVTARKINTPWAQTARDIFGKNAIVVTPNRMAQPITLDISLRRSTRYSMESGIRAELETSPTVYLEATDNYIYEDKEWCWFIPTGMNVTDKGATQPLRCVISGLLDERTIHSCEFLTGWSGTSLAVAPAPASVEPRFGAAAIKSTMGSSNIDYYIKYDFPAARDLSNLDMMHCWLLSSEASTWFDTCQFGLSDGSTTTLADVEAFATDTWSYQSLAMRNFAGNSSAVTEFIVKSNPPSVSPYSIYIAWVWVE